MNDNKGKVLEEKNLTDSLISNIPKKIHLIWLGSPKPKKFEYLLQKIKDINFDYEIIEWNDENINFELINEKLFRECSSYGAKSDILRFEILNKYGGIYMDYDFIQVKKFDDLLNNDFFVGSSNCCPDETWNSIIGASKGNQVCVKFLEGLKNTKPISKNEITRVMNETGPYYLNKIIQDNNLQKNITKLTGKYFFPFPAAERLKIKELNPSDIDYCMSYIDHNTYCVHLHTTTWQ